MVIPGLAAEGTSSSIAGAAHPPLSMINDFQKLLRFAGWYHKSFSAFTITALIREIRLDPGDFVKAS